MDLSISHTIICYFVITLNEIIVKNIFELFISFGANFSNAFLSLPEKTILQYGFYFVCIDKFYYHLDQEMGCARMLIHAKCVCSVGMQAWM